MTSEPRVTYVVLAHSRPGQLLRLVRVLREESPHCSVVIHWDRDSPLLDVAPFRELGKVWFVEDPVHPEWGGFQVVSALLGSMRTAVASTQFDWLVLLSGQDYPIVPLDRIEAELAASGADSFLDPGRIASGRFTFRWRRTSDTRLGRRYYFGYLALPAIGQHVPRRLRGALLRAAFVLDAHQPFLSLWPMPPPAPWRVGVRRCRTPFRADRPCRVGSTWLSLSRRGVERILEEGDDRSPLVRHYRRTIVADESFFQTIVCADPHLKVVPDNRRFQVWEHSDSPLHPDTLTIANLDEILSCGKHFARKFDEQLDSAVLNRIDEHRRRSRTVGGERADGQGPEKTASQTS